MRTLPYFSRPLATLAPRDLLLLEHLEISPKAIALEIGTGSGSSLFRFAPLFARLDGVDVCSGPLERIRNALRGPRSDLAHKIQLFDIDFCADDAHLSLPQKYDLIFSCDTIEHVPNPAAFLVNVYSALKPGGRAFLTYPNEHPRHAHGISFFERRQTLERLLVDAGFRLGDFRIDRLRMARLAASIAWLGWFGPRKLMKSVTALVRRRRERPQTFDQTEFFTVANRFERFSPLINAYCWLVMRLMAMVGEAYRIEAAGDVIWDTQILILASKSDDADFSVCREDTTACDSGELEVAVPLANQLTVDC